MCVPMYACPCRDKNGTTATEKQKRKTTRNTNGIPAIEKKKHEQEGKNDFTNFSVEVVEVGELRRRASVQVGQNHDTPPGSTLTSAWSGLE